MAAGREPSASRAPYRWLAEYYDLVFTPYRTPIVRARDRILGRILTGVSSMCDLACGTGTTAVEMARQGIETYAVDESPEMCRQARRKAKLAGLPIRVIRADMRSFQLPRPVDLITCEYDAINHIPERAGLKSVFDCAARSLKPGGYFYFDVNNRLAFERVWPGIFFIERPGVALIIRNQSDPPRNRAWSDVSWFIRVGNAWRRHQERVDEVCWNSGEIERGLGRAGFDSIHSWDAAPFFRGVPDVGPGCRTVWLARRKPTAND